MARRPEVVLTVAQRRRPERMARSAHAALREEWFIAVSQRKGSELLAVQTQRNSLMSATVTASTAMLGLIGTVTLVAPSLHASFGWSATLPSFTPRLVLELLLLTWGGRHKPVQVLRRAPPNWSIFIRPQHNYSECNWHQPTAPIRTTTGSPVKLDCNFALTRGFPLNFAISIGDCLDTTPPAAAQ